MAKNRNSAFYSKSQPRNQAVPKPRSVSLCCPNQHEFETAERQDDRGFASDRDISKARAIAISPFIGLLKIYKVAISPVFYAFGVRCRHWPTCSAYSRDAFIRHGVWAGGWLTLSRLLRCHPWGSHGIDPVPSEIPLARFAFWRLGDWGWHERKGDQ